MSCTPSDLQDLRRRLDEIDDRLQDLLIDRAEIVSMVAATKKDGNQPAFQPAREAEIIRRLVGRHRGAFPVATLVRMWREMLAATVSLQSPFSIAVLAPGDRRGLWDLARDHYGSNTPMAAYDAAGRVIRAVADGEASVGVLPLPQADQPDPWWAQLLSPDNNAPRVIARLPFGAPGNAHPSGGEALAIGCSVLHESGCDRSLLAMKCAAEISRARILKLLSARRLVCTFFASCDYRSSLINLIEIDGFVPISDSRLADFRGELRALRCQIVPIGGYAMPLPAAAFCCKRLSK